MALDQFSDLPESVMKSIRVDVTATTFLRTIGRKLMIFAALLVVSTLDWQWLTAIALMISVVTIVKQIFFWTRLSRSPSSFDQPKVLPDLRKKMRGSTATGTKKASKIRTFLWALEKKVTDVAPLFLIATISWNWLTEIAYVTFIVAFVIVVTFNLSFFWTHKEDIITFAVVLAFQRLNWMTLGVIMLPVIVSKTRSVFGQSGLPFSRRINTFYLELGKKLVIFGPLVVITTLCWQWFTEIAYVILITAIVILFIISSKYWFERGEETQVVVALLLLCALVWRWSIPMALLVLIIPNAIAFTIAWVGITKIVTSSNPKS